MQGSTMKWAGAVIGLGALALAACGGGDDDGESTSGSLVDAQVVSDAEDAAQFAGGAWGERVESHGVSFLLADPQLDELGTPDATLSFDLRVENSSEADVDWLIVSIECDGANTASGGWTRGSTIDLNTALPVGSFNEGRVVLYAPGGGMGEPLPECPNPRVEASAIRGGIISGDGIPRIAIPLDETTMPHD